MHRFVGQFPRGNGRIICRRSLFGQPQIFIPLPPQYSRPEKKGANVGLIVSGLLTGILASRVISGLVGEWLGWRAMYFIAAIVMSLCTLVVWRIMPYTENNYTGSYKRLMHSLFALIREYQTPPYLRPAGGFRIRLFPCIMGFSHV